MFIKCHKCKIYSAIPRDFLFFFLSLTISKSGSLPIGISDLRRFLPTFDLCFSFIAFSFPSSLLREELSLASSDGTCPLVCSISSDKPFCRSVGILAFSSLIPGSFSFFFFLVCVLLMINKISSCIAFTAITIRINQNTNCYLQKIKMKNVSHQTFAHRKTRYTIFP